jgi:hypothetical protein
MHLCPERQCRPIPVRVGGVRECVTTLGTPPPGVQPLLDSI